MAKSRKPPVERYHDRVAPRYDHSYEDAFWQWHDRLTWDYLKPHLPADNGAPIVDLGCGTGTWAARLAKSGYPVTCVDISVRMLDQAEQKLSVQGAAGRATFVQADLCDLAKLPRRHFALAVALGDPIGSTASPARAMKQIRRVLRDDGVLVATFDNRLAALEYYVQRGDPAELSRFLSDGKTHWLTRDQSEQFPIFTFAPDDLPVLVEKTGFAMLEMIGKTVLPMRRCRHLLESSDAQRHWARIEKKLARNPHALGRASHLQIACRVT